MQWLFVKMSTGRNGWRRPKNRVGHVKVLHLGLQLILLHKFIFSLLKVWNEIWMVFHWTSATTSWFSSRESQTCTLRWRKPCKTGKPLKAGIRAQIRSQCFHNPSSRDIAIPILLEEWLVNLTARKPYSLNKFAAKYWSNQVNSDKRQAFGSFTFGFLWARHDLFCGPLTPQTA